MALSTPQSANEIVEAAQLDVQREVVGSNPFLRNGYLRGIVVGISNRVWDFYYALARAALEALPDTAVLNLERWANIFGVNKIAGDVASGNLFVSGDSALVLSTGILWAVRNSDLYVSTGGVSLAQTPRSISVLTGALLVASVEMTAAHNLVNGVLVTITGATDTAYNVSNVPVTVIDSLNFTYATTVFIITSPDVGSPLYTPTKYIGVIAIESELAGADKNQNVNAEFTIQTPIANLDNLAYAMLDGIMGGITQESLESLRIRLLERIRNPIAHFNVQAITNIAKTVSGVTRVFVFENTKAQVAEIGCVEIYFVRGNDDNTIPAGAEIAAVDTAIQSIRPANTHPDDVVTLAPTAVPSVYTFSALSPDTPTMRTAIQTNLEAFFAEEPDVGITVLEDAYRSAIYNSVDSGNGAPLVSFTLSSPAAGPIAIVAGELATLTSVGFP